MRAFDPGSLLIALALVLAAVAPAVGQESNVVEFLSPTVVFELTEPPPAEDLPDDYPDVFDELVVIAQQDSMGWLDWIRISYLGPRLFWAGERGVPYNYTRFLDAVSPEEAFLGGCYVATCGGPAHLRLMREELEVNERKRWWLDQLVGSEAAFLESMEGGVDWHPAFRYLPSTKGLRLFALRCMGSDDPLVRRAGLFWGFWFPDDTYWTVVRRWMSSEPDAVTRRLAEYLARLYAPED